MKKFLIFSIVGATMGGVAYADPAPFLPGGNIGGGNQIPERCRITYECGTGSGEPVALEDSAGTLTVMENFCTKSGDTFVEWVVTGSDTESVSAATAHPGEEYDTSYCAGVSGNLTLTARWASEITSVMTSTAYVDTQVSGLQDNFEGLGANKLMTFGSTAGQVSSRDIVTTLGTPNASGIYSNTSDISVPTIGAINGGINAKQNLLDGTTGFAITGTGTDGTLGEKAIYSVQVGADSLIEAGTLNTAVVDAVNSEMTQIDETGEPDPNGTLWRINDSITLLPTSAGVDLMSLIGNVAGTDSGYVGFYSEGSNQNIYGLTQAGTFVVDYGNGKRISGKAQCSTRGVTNPWDNNNYTFEQDHFTSTLPDSNGQYCYCTLDGYTTTGANWGSMESLSAPWVFGVGLDSSCKGNCAIYCPAILRNGDNVDNAYGLAFRAAVFGATH